MVEDRGTPDRLFKDILYFFHIQGETSYWWSDLDWSCFDLPYWLYLEDGFDLEKSDAKFIQNGCLLIILAMYWDDIDGSGSYILENLEECLILVDNMKPLDKEIEKLQGIVKTIGFYVGKDTPFEERPFFGDEMSWVYNSFISDYFLSVSNRIKVFKDGI